MDRKVDREPVVMVYLGSNRMVAVSMPWDGVGRIEGGTPEVAALDDSDERIGGLILELVRREPTVVSDAVTMASGALRKSIAMLLESPGKDVVRSTDFVLLTFGPDKVTATFGGRAKRSSRSKTLGSLDVATPPGDAAEVGALVRRARSELSELKQM